MALAAAMATALALAACGDSESEPDSISQQELQEAVRDAEREGRRQAETEAKLDDLRDQVEDLEGEQDSQAGASPGATPTPTDSQLVAGYDTYISTEGGWSAEVPVGGGWSDGTDTEVRSGRLFRTEFNGPGDTVLVIDSTPFDTPTFSGAPIDSRATVTHPVYGSVEQIVFQGNSRIGSCDRGLCVDYLIDTGDGGGYAVLAGGPGDFDSIAAIAEHVMQSLRYYDY